MQVYYVTASAQAYYLWIVHQRVFATEEVIGNPHLLITVCASHLWQ